MNGRHWKLRWVEAICCLMMLEMFQHLLIVLWYLGQFDHHLLTGLYILQIHMTISVIFMSIYLNWQEPVRLSDFFYCLVMTGLLSCISLSCIDWLVPPIISLCIFFSFHFQINSFYIQWLFYVQTRNAAFCACNARVHG